MIRRNFLRYALEVIVMAGFLVLGMTILSYIFNKMPFDRIFIGSIVLATGVLDFADYCTWKFARRMRSIPSLVSSFISVALGLLFLIVNIEPTIMCIIWGALNIAFAIAKIATGAANIAYQPLINSIKIILSIISIVYSILLIVRRVSVISHFMVFLAVAMTVQALTLFVEFVIHRYQRI